MTLTPHPIPSVPWQITGNHWLALPCIHPADASIHAVGVLHRGSRAAIELAGSPDFLEGTGRPLAGPAIEIGGVRRELSSGSLTWERALSWIPTFTTTIDSILIRGTLFAPYGRDADVAGAVYALSLENRSGQPADVTVMLSGELGHRQWRVRSARALPDQPVVASGDGVIAFEITGAPNGGLVALAVAGDESTTGDAHAGGRFELRRRVALDAGKTEQVAFYLAMGPERDGAVATANALRRRGWRELLSATRDALRGLEQTTGNAAVDRLINRNLLFAYFYGVGRALDDAHFYLVRTRAPWHSAGVTLRDWEALMWTVPAVQLADATLARELILRTCELHGYAAGRGVQYLDGTLFEPGFSLEGVASFAIATERYVRETSDEHIVDDPALADTLYLVADMLASRRNKRIPLYSTEVTLGGVAPPHPFTLHGNAVVAQAIDSLRRTLDEETAATLEDPDAIRAAVNRHFVLERDGKNVFASSVDLAGAAATDDDPSASVLWLPVYETLPREDSTYRRAAKRTDPEPTSLAQRCARLIGPDSATALDRLRRAPLDGGLAAELVDADGRATANGGDASLAGLLAWSAWYAVQALGAKP